jgi:MFS family permease
VWSTLTSLSGLSQNTTQLCFLRVGIGLGEAGCTPAAQSLIAVMYGPGERASAMVGRCKSKLVYNSRGFCA